MWFSGGCVCSRKKFHSCQVNWVANFAKSNFSIIFFVPCSKKNIQCERINETKIWGKFETFWQIKVNIIRNVTDYLFSLPMDTLNGIEKKSHESSSKSANAKSCGCLQIMQIEIEFLTVLSEVYCAAINWLDCKSFASCFKR